MIVQGHGRLKINTFHKSFLKDSRLEGVFSTSLSTNKEESMRNLHDWKEKD